MSKNNKEKSSFWKKLGLGKNKTPSSLSLKSEHDDKMSIKSKRLSGGTFLSHPPPLPQQNNNNYETVVEPPLPPIKTIKKQPRVNLPKVNLDNSSDILSDFQLQQLEQQHVYNNNLNNEPSTTFDIPSSNKNGGAAGVQGQQLQQKSIVTPTADVLHQESLFNEAGKKNDQEQKQRTEQPNKQVTPAAATMIMDNDNNSNSSFVVVKSTLSNDNNTPLAGTDDEVLKATNNKELLSIISSLKLQLENEKATVNVLQKQKEAVAKDLDYLELTVDELFSEKTDLLQQLEDEKIKSQRYLDDLNLSLEKQRSNADNARDQSIVVGQTKQEFEAYQEQCRQEQQELLSEIKQRDKTIRELKYKLNKSQEQVETLKTTMDQLVISQTEEISRLTAAHQAALAQQAEEFNNKEKSGWPLHTPNGSPRMQHKDTQQTGEEQEEQEQENWQQSPVPSSSTPYFNQQQQQRRTTKESVDYSSSDMDDLDDQLKRLLKEKEQLQSSYSKIPITGGGPQSRKRKEEIESKLDQVDSQLSKIRQKIRRS